MKSPDPYEEPIDVIAEEARVAVRCFGVSAPDQLAAALIDRIVLRLGGLHLYLPRRSARERRRMRTDIAERFDGTNVAQLAREHSVTPRYVRKILSSVSPQSRAD